MPKNLLTCAAAVLGALLLTGVACPQGRVTLSLTNQTPTRFDLVITNDVDVGTLQFDVSPLSTTIPITAVTMAPAFAAFTPIITNTATAANVLLIDLSASTVIPPATDLLVATIEVAGTPGSEICLANASAADPLATALTTTVGACVGPAVAAYGVGCAGGGRPIPALSPLGRAVVGDPSFGMRLTDGAPGAFSFLLIGFDEEPGPCQLLTAPFDSVRVFGVPATGAVDLPVPVPPSPSLSGVYGAFQVASVQEGDGGLLSLFDMSNAVRFRIGY